MAEPDDPEDARRTLILGAAILVNRGFRDDEDPLRFLIQIGDDPSPDPDAYEFAINYTRAVIEANTPRPRRWWEVWRTH